VIQPAELARRILRLDQLMRGMSREVLIWRRGNDPLLYAERQAYLEAIQDALAAVEAARVVLVRARQRIDRDATPGSAASDPTQSEP
jgi:hypothetical protein